VLASSAWWFFGATKFDIKFLVALFRKHSPLSDFEMLVTLFGVVID